MSNEEVIVQKINKVLINAKSLLSQETVGGTVHKVAFVFL